MSDTPTDRPRLRFGVAHDFRRPAHADVSLQDVYAQTIDQLRTLDALGLDLVWFSEHHFVPDGYLPNFVPVAGATAAVTTNLRISTNVALAPFAHPLRLAEDLAILDQLSGGRMELGLGLAYAPHEFKAFGIPVSRRVSLTEECVQILQLAWRGEPFSFHGKRYDVDDVLVTPAPVQPGGPPLWMAVTSPLSAARAVRFGVNALPQGSRAETLDAWHRERATAGDTATRRIGIIRNVFVTDDPERDWPPIRDAERYRMKVYAGFAEDAGKGGRAAFEEPDRIPQRAIIGDADHCVAELVAFVREYGLTDVVTWGSAPGLAPEVLTPMMERFARDVAPRVKAVVDGA